MDNELRLNILKFFRDNDVLHISLADLPGHGLSGFERTLLKLQREGFIHCYLNDKDMTDKKEIIAVEFTKLGDAMLKRLKL